MSGILYVVGTPIGNLSDFSPRAIDTLASVDFIAAEDTRVTLKLLNHFDIKKEMVSYFEHNKRQRGKIICQRILAGESCAIVTDAGMPAISDPGEDLVALCHELGIVVQSVPGPTAFATALAISGMPTGRFTFEGFLSVNKKSRREHLEEIKDEKRTMIFYEAPHRIMKTLNMMLEVFGDRDISISREITKKFETVYRGKLSDVIKNITEKGEFVIVITGCEEKVIDDNLSIKEAANLYIKAGLDVMTAIKKVAKDRKIPKNEVYKEYHKEEK